MHPTKLRVRTHLTEIPTSAVSEYVCFDCMSRL
jgi:hypothetical protein